MRFQKYIVVSTIRKFLFLVVVDVAVCRSCCLGFSSLCFVGCEAVLGLKEHPNDEDEDETNEKSGQPCSRRRPACVWLW